MILKFTLSKPPRHSTKAASRVTTGSYLQPQGEQLQRPDSQVQEQEQEPLHLHFLAGFTLAFLRSFD
jgi:hypothetical protein